MLAEKLQVPFHSVGNTTRGYAKRNFGLGIIEFQQYCLSHPEVDKKLDEYFSKMGHEMDGFVMDYRLGFHFIPEAFHVLLTVPDEITAHRVLAAKRNDEFTTTDYETILLELKTRNAKMRERFINQYSVDYEDKVNYNLVLDASKIDPFELVRKIKDSF